MIKVAQQKADAALDELRDFEARNSPDGLFLRYCRGRAKNFLMRQSATVIGSIALAVFYQPLFGLIAALTALLGEAVDSLVTHRIWRRYNGRDVPRLARRLAAGTAAFQALTIAVCVVLGWALAPYQDSRLFAAAFLIGTAMNAGVVRPFFRLAADLRLGIYALTLVGLVVHDTALRTLPAQTSPGQGLFLIGAAMMVFVTVTFLVHVSRTHRTRTRFEHDLLREKHQLALSRAAARENERRSRMLALVAENANDAVMITDPDGKIEWVNETFTRLNGYSLEEATGHAPGALLFHETVAPETVRLVQEARTNHKPLRTEVPTRTKAGALIWMETSLTPVFDEDGDITMTIAIVRDISEAKEREAELAEARAEAERSAQAKAQFLAAMSHEIRTPMNGVIATAELLSATRLDADQTTYVETIVESGRALLTIINDVLDLSRLQSGNPVIRQAPFDIRDCLAGVINLLHPEARKKALRLTVDCADNLPPLLGDEGRIRQILINLVGNAIKFTEQGEVGVRLEHHPGDASETIVITVTDTGIGIAPDRLERIFESFTQAGADIARRFGGTGLGLTISRLLAQQMGGDITADSAPGQGARFVLFLQLPRDVDAALSPAPEPHTWRVRNREAADAQCEKDCVILVAEDNRTNAFIVEKMLAGPDRVLHFAADGAAAVAMFRAVRPDLVLMDMSMPIMDGLDATRAIRAIEAEEGRGARCPIVALTANAFDEDRATCMEAGCDEFLTKPVAKAELLAMLQRYETAEDTKLAQGPSVQADARGVWPDDSAETTAAPRNGRQGL
jgi:PAS domain S-box-containing protein